MLSGRDRELLNNAIRDTFPEPTELKRVLAWRLQPPVRLDDIVLGPNYQHIVFELIQHLEARGRTGEFIACAREYNAGEAQLIRLSQVFGLTALDQSTENLERLVRRDGIVMDFNEWLHRFGLLEPRVCQVEVFAGGSVSHGTGFLVGPDLVLTNHHVVESAFPHLLARTSPGPDIRFRFDYKVLSGTRTINAGTVYTLAKQSALVDWSPQQAEQAGRERDVDPTEDELDYALLRIEGSPGLKSVSDSGGEARGWIEVPDGQVPQAGSSTFIVQHPQRKPMKMAVGVILGTNRIGTRLRYDANTDIGSSGAPCVDSAVRLVALHHAGGPGRIGTYNQGVPIGLIARRLAKSGISIAPPTGS